MLIMKTYIFSGLADYKVKAERQTLCFAALL